MPGQFYLGESYLADGPAFLAPLAPGVILGQANGRSTRRPSPPPPHLAKPVIPRALPTHYAWTKAAPSSSPTARFAYGMCTDRNGDVVMLGGDPIGSGALGEFWRYTEPAGVPTWTQITGMAATPWSLAGGASGIRDCLGRYDALTDRIVAFGGDTNLANQLADTFLYNQAANTWTLGTTPGGMAGRAEYAMDYDPATGRPMLACGWKTGGPPFNADAWIYTGTTWTQTGTNPTARAGCAMATDWQRGIVVLFGGHTDVNYEVLLSDTWIWNGTTWSNPSPTHVPFARTQHQMWYDPVLQMVVMYGGFNELASNNAQNDLQDMWGWNGSDWVKISQDSLASIYCFTDPGIYSTKLGKIVRFGGQIFNNTSVGAETWTAQAVFPSVGLSTVQGSLFLNVGATASLVFNHAPIDAGNFIVVHLSADATGVTFTAPSAQWTLVKQETATAPSSAVFVCAQPTPGATTYTFTASSGAATCTGQLTEMRGVRITGGGDGPVSANGSGTSAAPSGGTPIGAGEPVIVSVAISGQGTNGLTTASNATAGYALITSNPDNTTADPSLAQWGWYKAGTGLAPSASLSWTTPAGGSPAFTTIITSLLLAPFPPTVLVTLHPTQRHPAFVLTPRPHLAKPIVTQVPAFLAPEPMVITPPERSLQLRRAPAPHLAPAVQGAQPLVTKAIKHTAAARSSALFARQRVPAPHLAPANLAPAPLIAAVVKTLVARFSALLPRQSVPKPHVSPATLAPSPQIQTVEKTVAAQSSATFYRRSVPKPHLAPPVVTPAAAFVAPRPFLVTLVARLNARLFRRHPAPHLAPPVIAAPATPSPLPPAIVISQAKTTRFQRPIAPHHAAPNLAPPPFPRAIVLGQKITRPQIGRSTPKPHLAAGIVTPQSTPFPPAFIRSQAEQRPQIGRTVPRPHTAPPIVTPLSLAPAPFLRLQALARALVGRSTPAPHTARPVLSQGQPVAPAVRVFQAIQRSVLQRAAPSPHRPPSIVGPAQPPLTLPIIRPVVISQAVARGPLPVRTVPRPHTAPPIVGPFVPPPFNQSATHYPRRRVGK